MAYAASTDLEERLGSAVYVQLTDDGGTGTADEDKVAEALAGAEGEVNSYVGRRYAVPVATAGEAQLAAVLKSVTLDLAEYRLHARRPPAPAEAVRKREAALNWLWQVARGEAVLPSAGQLAQNPAEGFSGVSIGAERVLSREELEDL